MFKNVFSIAAMLAGMACNGHSAGSDYNPPPDISPGQSMAAPSTSRLRIMSYNVLRYGNGCQGANGTMHRYLKTIITYTNPDVAALVKVDAIRQSAGDTNGDAPVGFADAILKQVFGSSYAVAPFTNKAVANNMNLLFYNQEKLGFAGIETLVSDETDFNLFRLYLKASVTAQSHDTAFIYFILNHTESGDKPKNRDRQMKEVMAALHRRFKVLPNLVDLGDFNLRNTNEAGYQSLIAGNGEFHLDDPPFSIDHSVKYPADWENDPDSYARYLTTSTRKKDDEPNECGTGGGAKFWFDHILLSPAITSGRNGFSYIKRSFRVIGNDGNRNGRSGQCRQAPEYQCACECSSCLVSVFQQIPGCAGIEYFTSKALRVFTGSIIIRVH